MIRAAFLGLALSCAASAATAQVAGSVHVGTVGVGVEAQIALAPTFVLRGGVDRLRHDFDERYGGIDYAGELDFDTVGVFVDLHPFANGLFISGGGYLGPRDLELSAEPTTPVEIGGAMFSPAQVGRLTGGASLNQVSPFVGFGFDNTFTRSGRIGVRALFGVAVGEDPHVTLNSTGGSLSNNAAFRTRLDAEARRIEDEAEYSIYPVAQLGLTWRF